MLDSEFDLSDKSEQGSKPFDPKVDLTSTDFELVKNTITSHPFLHVPLTSNADVCWPDRNLPTLLGNDKAESALEDVRKTAPNILLTEDLIDTLEYAAAIRRVFPGITVEQLNSVKTGLHNDEGLLDSARKIFHFARERGDPQTNSRLLAMLSIAARLEEIAPDSKYQVALTKEELEKLKRLVNRFFEDEYFKKALNEIDPVTKFNKKIDSIVQAATDLKSVDPQKDYQPPVAEEQWSAIKHQISVGLKSDRHRGMAMKLAKNASILAS